MTDDSIILVAAVKSAYNAIRKLSLIEQAPKPTKKSKKAMAAENMVSHFVFDDAEVNACALATLCHETPDNFDAWLVYLHYMKTCGAYSADMLCISTARLCVQAINNKSDFTSRVLLIAVLVESLMNANAFIDATTIASVAVTRFIRCFAKVDTVCMAFYNLVLAGGRAAEKANLVDVAIGFYKLAWKLVLAAQEDYISSRCCNEKHQLSSLIRCRSAASRLIALQCKTISTTDFVFLVPVETFRFVLEQQNHLATAEFLVAIDVCLLRRLMNASSFQKLFPETFQNWDEQVQVAHRIIDQEQPRSSTVARLLLFDAPKTCLVCNLVATYHQDHNYCDLHIEQRKMTRFDN